LSKADLATDMVRELTELQGTMGGIYAREAGEPEAVWKAIAYHYLPTAVEADAAPRPDVLGAARVTWASLALADKLDTLAELFSIGERPTGSRDPYGLRRAAHGVLRILIDAEPLTGVSVRPAIGTLVARAFAEASSADAAPELEAFLTERLQYVLEARGADRRNARSVLAGRTEVRVADAAANLAALAALAKSPSFQQLATAFKRVRNIARELAEEPAGAPDLRAALTEPAEIALFDEIERRQPVIDRAVADGRGFDAAYEAAAGFEPVVARFFDEVFVMSDDLALREARLRLMKRLERVILQLGDISEIVASE
jgi:glycyl-tRNA synthetase beta chain